MKFLCICTYGHSRSVALVRELHRLKQDAVAIGWATSGDSIKVLSKWADKIVVIDPHAISKIPIMFHWKVVDFDLGPDKWSNPYHPELAKICREFVAGNFPDLS